MTLLPSAAAFLTPVYISTPLVAALFTDFLVSRLFFKELFLLLFFSTHNQSLIMASTESPRLIATFTVTIEIPDLEELLRAMASSGKDGISPASKASIEAMPTVKIAEAESECNICLEDLEIGAEARAMPCNHRFHGSCIEKWLGLHGSCPVCRYQMPLEEKDEEEKGQREEVAGGGDGDEDGGDGDEDSGEERMEEDALLLGAALVFSIMRDLRSGYGSYDGEW